MIALSKLFLICQIIQSKLVSFEDYITIQAGGWHNFDDYTVVQNFYYLEPHYQISTQIRAIFASCVYSFRVQLDDAIQIIDHTQFTSNQPVELSFSFLHTSRSVFISLETDKQGSCSNQNAWWGIFTIQIHITNCKENEDYCSPGSNNQWILLHQFLYFQITDWQTTSAGQDMNYQFKNILIVAKRFSNTYRLGKHYKIPYQTKVKFQFKLFFRYQPSQIQIILSDDVLIDFPIANYYIQRICDQSVLIYNIDIDIKGHRSDLLLITLFLSNNSGTNDVSIFDFIVYYQKQVIFSQPILGCSNVIDQICISCKEGWELNFINQDCDPICGDKLIQGNEECDDGNDIQYDGCYKCKFQCSLDCKECYIGKCLVYSYPIILDQYDTYKEVQNCQQNKGYYYDYQLNDCQSICGDGFITIDEECDDGNNFLNDGCIYCKYNCSDNCINCQHGKCYQCNIGYEILQFKCIAQCGDNLIKLDEICDDGNNYRFDGCYQCQNSCQLECIDCQNSFCIQCLFGWNLIDGKCEQKCGDGLVAFLSNEQCDDPFISNCIDCQYQQCQDNCQICSQNQCNICFFPYQLINGLCQPKCGDSIITYESEQCDDGNDIPFDGCYECQYQCSYGCLLCEQGDICKKCDENLFFLDPQTAKCEKIGYVQNNQIEIINYSNNNDVQFAQNYEFQDYICVNQCGNGLLNSLYEECDDGNNNGGDGCSSFCNIEQYFLCNIVDNQLSTCSFIIPPDFDLKNLSDRQDQIQIIQFTFTKQVRLIYQDQFDQLAIFTIIPTVTHELTIIPKQNLTIDLNNPIYLIQIYFKQYVENPKLKIEVSKFSILDEFNLDLQNYINIINLGNPFVISDTTQKQVVTITKFNDAMMYSMASIAGLALMTGNIVMILNLLDLLQSLSYICYMQYQFPPHLRKFLETYTRVSLQPLLDYFQIDAIIAKLNGGLLPYKKKQLSNSNSSLNINQHFFINAKSCYFSLLASFLTYLICSALTSQIVNQKIQNYHKQYFQNQRFLKLLLLFQTKIQQNCLKIKNDYFSLGLFQLYFSVLHQLAFSTFLQFPVYSFQTFFESFNTINAALALILILVMSLKMLSITSSSIRTMSKWKYFYQGTKSQFWAINFKSFQIFRIKFYIFVIVFCMNYPQVQSILLSMQSLLYLGYLCKFRPLTSNFDLIKLMLRELLLMIIFASFLLYSFDYTNNQFLFIGWLHIYLFSFILSTSLIVDLLQYIKKVYKNYLRKKIQQQNLELKRCYENPLQRFILIENQNVRI